MTDNEIIKALECCVYGSPDDCDSCKFQGNECRAGIICKALDLINRQKAEIEKLNIDLVGMRGACESYKIHYDNAQAEIERYKKNETLIHAKCDSIQERLLLLNVQIAEAITTAKSEAYREFAEILRTTNSTVETVLNKLLSNDMGRYDHYTDSFVKELTRNLHGTCTESNERF